MILQSIEIENFRCFRHSRFENFGQVNLIGGKNNAGKTALLEALLLVNEPTWESVAFLQQMRGENSRVFGEHPELAWGNLFQKQDKSAAIKLQGEYSEKVPNTVTITCKEKPKSAKNGIGPVSNNGDLVKVIDSATMSEVGDSRLIIESLESNRAVGIYYEWESEPGRYFGPRIASNGDPNLSPSTFLFPASFKKTMDTLAGEFDKAKLREFDKPEFHDDTASILEAFRLVDDTIEKIDSINVGEPRIYIFRKGEKPQSLNFFGDALNKVASLMLQVVNSPNCTLLIDEIENGIHHDSQEKFWKLLIKLAVKKNVQIFATSHSAEMIEAFQAAAVADKQEDKVRYIEMFRSARTGEIIGAQRDMETLEYNLRTKNPYRGE